MHCVDAHPSAAAAAVDEHGFSSTALKRNKLEFSERLNTSHLT